MMRKLFMLFSIVFLSNIMYGQFTDSLIFANSFDSDKLFTFNFLKKNSIKKVNHYIGYYNEKGKISYHFLEYKIYADKKLNRIVHRYNKHYKEYFSVDKYGNLICCGEFPDDSCTNSSHALYDTKGNIIKYDLTRFYYDSLNRLTHIIAPLEYDTASYYETIYTYEKEKLLKEEKTGYTKGKKMDMEFTSTYYFYTSANEFGYTFVYPSKWLRKPDKFIYNISANKKVLACRVYTGDALSLKYIDKIIN